VRGATGGGVARRCDVLVVGGGPAGSSCARALVQAGLDVVVVDRARFPRDKPCAGWITPAVVSALDLDLDEYASRRTLQPIRGFDVGVLDGRRTVVRFDEVASYAIRRCEFDTFLLERCGADVRQGAAVTRLERVPGGWRVDPVAEARMLVGAGGHFCPVARMLNPHRDGSTVVAAQELEVRLEPGDLCPVEGAVPELYFCRDLRGYGWCVRKGEYLNVGFGRLDRRGVAEAARAFLEAVRRIGRVPRNFPSTWIGHAYHVRAWTDRRLHDDGVVLVGDAAGLAYPASGEGILPAAVSGLLAAGAILSAAPDFGSGKLAHYEAALAERFGGLGRTGRARWRLPDPLVAWAGRRLMASPWFVRRVVVPRWFLHATARAA
jgi:menaquinone-9 beta-reductase